MCAMRMENEGGMDGGLWTVEAASQAKVRDGAFILVVWLSAGLVRWLLRPGEATRAEDLMDRVAPANNGSEHKARSSA